MFAKNNDFEKQRKIMVEDQIIARGIRDSRIVETFLKVERHKFVPKNLRNSAYGDFPLPIGEGQTISQPYIVALMTSLLSLTGREKVLEVGTGSGYQAAVLAGLSDQVYSLERIQSLAENAKAIIQELGYKNVSIEIGDGSLGLPDKAPFQRIIVTAASPSVPLPLVEQLDEKGIMVIPIAGGFSQILTVVKKEKAALITEEICGCIFVPLVGKYGLKTS